MLRAVFITALLIAASCSAFVVPRTTRSGEISRLYVGEKYTWKQILSGQPQIDAEKNSSPELFGNGARKAKSNKGVKLTESGKQAIEAFNTKYAGSKKGGSKDLDDFQLGAVFNAMAKITKDEAIALDMVKIAPRILCLDPERFTATFAVFENTYGFEKALGLITRNPDILSIAPSGYASAEVAGDDAIAMSYLIAFTRPIGAPLLATLGLLLVSPAIKSVLGIE